MMMMMMMMMMITTEIWPPRYPRLVPLCASQLPFGQVVGRGWAKFLQAGGKVTPDGLPESLTMKTDSFDRNGRPINFWRLLLHCHVYEKL